MCSALNERRPSSATSSRAPGHASFGWPSCVMAGSPGVPCGVSRRRSDPPSLVAATASAAGEASMCAAAAASRCSWRKKPGPPLARLRREARPTIRSLSCRHPVALLPPILQGYTHLLDRLLCSAALPYNSTMKPVRLLRSGSSWMPIKSCPTPWSRTCLPWRRSLSPRSTSSSASAPPRSGSALHPRREHVHHAHRRPVRRSARWECRTVDGQREPTGHRPGGHAPARGTCSPPSELSGPR